MAACSRCGTYIEITTGLCSNLCDGCQRNHLFPKEVEPTEIKMVTPIDYQKELRQQERKELFQKVALILLQIAPFDTKDDAIVGWAKHTTEAILDASQKFSEGAE